MSLYNQMTQAFQDPMFGMGAGLMQGAMPGGNVAQGLQLGLSNAQSLQAQQFRQQQAVEAMLQRAQDLEMRRDAATFRKQQAEAAAAQTQANLQQYGVPDPTTKMLETGLPAGDPYYQQTKPLVTVNTGEVPRQAQPMSTDQLQQWGLPVDTVAYIDDKGNPKIVDASKGKGDAYQTQAQIEASLNNYRTQLGNYGTKIVPSGEKLKLKASYNDLLLEAKELYNLGALQGPDLELMNQVMQDPTMWTSQIYTGEQMLEQLDAAFGSKVQNARQILDQRYGEQTTPTTQTLDWSDL